MAIRTPQALEHVQLLDEHVTWTSVQERQLQEHVPSFINYEDAYLISLMLITTLGIMEQTDSQGVSNFDYYPGSRY